MANGGSIGPGSLIASALSPIVETLWGAKESPVWEYKFGEPGYREHLGGYYPAAQPLGVTDPYTETYRSDILPRTEEDFTKVITGPGGKYIQSYDVGAGPFAQLEQELLARHDERNRQTDLNIPTGYYTGATIKRYGDLGTLEETINAPRIDIYPDDRTVFSGGVRQVIEPSSVADALRSASAYPSQDYGPTSGYLGQFPSRPALQDTTQPGYMQQGVAPWVSALATGIRPVLAAPLAGLSMMTTTHPYIGGAIGTSPVRKIDTGEGTAYTFPEPYLDYPGDTAKERLQEHITSLALQNAITADDQPLTNIFRGDTVVDTDLQFTPEEAMTSNISNALLDYDMDVQNAFKLQHPELQAIAELREVDPTFNFEKYLDPASQEVMDITSQVESFANIPTVQPGAETPWTPPAPVVPDISEILKTYVPPPAEGPPPAVEDFSAIQEANQQRMEREAAKQETDRLEQVRADNKRRADEAAARQEQVRADNQRRAEEAREAQDRARENRERQEAQAERARAIAEKSKAADDRKAAARAQARADAAAKKERQATIQRKEDNRRRQATERAAAAQRRAAQKREQAARAKEAAARAQQQSRAQAAAAAARARAQAAARARNIAAENRLRSAMGGTNYAAYLRRGK